MLSKCLLLSLMVGLVGCGRQSASSPRPKETPVSAGEIGSRLPAFTVDDLQGHKISSADLHGKVVLVDFWATWCQPCKQEMPGYQKLLDRYGSQGLAVVGIRSNAMADTESSLKFAKKVGVYYPLVVATDDLERKFGGIVGLPTTLLYDRHGILRKKIIRFEYTDAIEAELKKLL